MLGPVLRQRWNSKELQSVSNASVEIQVGRSDLFPESLRQVDRHSDKTVTGGGDRGRAQDHGMMD